MPLLADAAPRVRFFAAEALGRLRYAPAAQPLVQMLADNDDRDAYLRHEGSAALASIGDAPAIAALASHPSRGVRLAAVVALRRLHDPSVARFLDDADQLVVTEAARAINDDGGIAGAVPALARVLDRRGVTNEGLVRRAIAANARLGSADAFSRLTSFARAATDVRASRRSVGRARGLVVALDVRSCGRLVPGLSRLARKLNGAQLVVDSGLLVGPHRDRRMISTVPVTLVVPVVPTDP